MLGSVTKKTVCDAFSRMGIGDVTELDMIYKINENRNAYYIAFIKLNPHNTPQSTDLQSKLKRDMYTRLLYDEEAGQYWELKKYIPRADRVPETNKQIDSTHNISLDMSDKNSNSINSSQYSFMPTTLIHQTPPDWNPIMPIVDSITTMFNHYTSPFTAQDRIDLVREYDELEREIYIKISTI